MGSFCKSMHLLVITFFLLFVSSNLFALNTVGLSLVFSNATVKENAEKGHESLYFIEKDESKRSHYGLNIHFHRQLMDFRYLQVFLGPYAEIGTLELKDTMPVDLSGEGGLFYGFGVEGKFLIPVHKKFRPYFIFGVGPEWASIDWEAKIAKAVPVSTVNYTEKIFGISTRLALGVEYRVLQKITAFAHVGLGYSFFSSQMDESKVSGSNSYTSNALQISAGVMYLIR